MNKALAAHYSNLLADHGNFEGQFKYGYLVHAGGGMRKNISVAPQYLKYIINLKERMAQLDCEIARKRRDIAQAHLPHPGAFLFEVNGEPRDQIYDEDAEVELETGIRLPGEHGLSHLKIAADAGFAIAEFFMTCVLMN
jgi:TPR repeat protein